MFWLLNSTGMCVLYATQFCVAFLLLKMEMSVQLVGLFSGLTSVVEAKAGGGEGVWVRVMLINLENTCDLAFYLDTLIMIRSLQNFNPLNYDPQFVES